MTLLKEIQNDLVAPSVKLSAVLRKVSILAYRLKADELKTWVDRELAGYDKTSNADLPDYRITSTESLGQFIGPMGSGMDNAPIPLADFPEEVRKWTGTVYFRQSIRELESLLESNQHMFQDGWPSEMALNFPQVYVGLRLVRAWRVVTREQVEYVLETVRNRVLKFILEIEERFPNAGEDNPGNPKVPAEDVRQIFISVVGNQNTIAGISIDHTTSSQVKKENFSSLKTALERLGVPEEGIQSLQDAIKADGKPKKQNGFGQNVKEWLGTMTMKIATGAWKVAVEAAPTVVVKALSNYYGWQ